MTSPATWFMVHRPISMISFDSVFPYSKLLLDRIFAIGIFVTSYFRYSEFSSNRSNFHLSELLLDCGIVVYFFFFFGITERSRTFPFRSESSPNFGDNSRRTKNEIRRNLFALLFQTKGKVYVRALWPIRMKLIPVSVG